MGGGKMKSSILKCSFLRFEGERTYQFKTWFGVIIIEEGKRTPSIPISSDEKLVICNVLNKNDGYVGFSSSETS